jgi:hypothetical protein
VEGTVKREAQISEFRFKKTEDGYEAIATFENSGNVDIIGKGTLNIIDNQGFVLARSRFNEVYTMPLDKAKLYIQGIKAELKKGRYDVVLTFDLGEGILVKEYQIDVSSSGDIAAIKENG